MGVRLIVNAEELIELHSRMLLKKTKYEQHRFRLKKQDFFPCIMDGCVVKRAVFMVLKKKEYHHGPAKKLSTLVRTSGSNCYYRVMNGVIGAGRWSWPGSRASVLFVSGNLRQFDAVMEFL